MALNSSIFNNPLNALKSPEAYMAERQGIEGNRLNLLMQRGQHDAQQRGVADDAAYRDAVRGFGADSGANVNMLRTRGLGKQAMDLEASNLKAKESQGKIQGQDISNSKAAFELKQAQTLQHLQQVGGISSVQDAHAWIDAAEAAGELPPGRAPQVKQALATGQLDLNQWKSGVQNGGLTLMQQRDNEFKAAAQAEVERNNKAQSGIAMRGQDITVRGQNMVDARTRETTAATMSKPFEVTGPDGMPQLVQQDKQGNIRPVQGYSPKAKAAGASTEAERNAGGYMMRMDEATKLLDKFESKGAATYGTQAAGAVPIVGRALQRVAMSPEQQQYKQAQEDWVRAKLRKESGASIATDEMQKEIETYFPMPGEGKEVIAQKRQARAVANAAMKQSAGRASAAPAAGGASGGWGDGWSIQEVK